MSEFIQPKSPLNLNLEVDQLEENSAHTKSMTESIIGEEETGTEVTQEEADQTRSTHPEEPSRVNLNIEDVGQIGETETSQGKDTALGE